MTTIKRTTNKVIKLLCSVAFLGMVTGTAYAGPILGSLEYNGRFIAMNSGGFAPTSLGLADYLSFAPTSDGESSTGDIATLLGAPTTGGPFVVGQTTGALNLYSFAIDVFINPTLVWDNTASGLAFNLTSMTIVQQTVGAASDILILSGSGLFTASGYDDTDAIWTLTAEDAGEDTLILTFSASTAVPEPSMLALLGLTLMGLGWTRRRKLSRVA